MSVDSRSRAEAGGSESGAVRPHFPGLDAYRAIGMLMVFLAHAHYASSATDKGWLDPILDRFDIGLPIFFVLSGFLLFRPFVATQFASRPPMPARRFYRHRILRIFPGYWFALTAIVIFMGIQFTSIAQGVAFYALLQDYGTGPVFDPEFQPIYQAWSLATELMFYAFLPPLALLARRLLRHRDIDVQMRGLLAGCAVLYLAGAAFRMYLVAADPSWQSNAVLWLPAWLDLFALGMALAVISARVAYDGQAPNVVTWFARHPGAAWAVAAVLFVIITLVGTPDTPLVVTKEYVFRQTIYGVCAVFFLFPGMFGDPYTGRIRAFLRLRVMTYFGAISLGFYLFHVAFLGKAEEWTSADPFRANFVLVVLIALPLTFLAANLSYYVVERPFLRLKDRPISSLWREPSRFWASDARA